MKPPRRHGRRLATLLAVTALALSPLVHANAATTRVEAERATLSGGAAVATDHTGYSGTGFVGGFTDGNRGAAKAAFAVSASSAGDYALGLGYANGTGSARTLTLTVDGASPRQVTLPATAGWDSWATSTTTVALTAGSHSVAYAFGSADNGNVNVDYLDVTPSSPGDNPTTGPLFEAERGALSGGAVTATDHTGFTGTGFVGGYTDGNKGSARTTFAVSTTSAGEKSLAVRYANGTGAVMTLSLYVDRTRLRQMSLPATANWDTWSTATESATLGAGNHAIAVAFDSTDSGNVNLDSLTVTSVVVGPPAGPGEAESAFLSGGAAVGTSTSGFSGTGYVSGFGTTGARLVRTVAMADAGTATATIRFANSSGASRTLGVTANGRDAGTATLPSGADWRTTTVPVPLRAGVNTLALTGTGGDALVDSVVVAGETALAARGATLPYTEYEAEAGSTNGSVLAADRTFKTVQSESSGRRAVRLTTGQSVSVTLTKPANAVVVRYSIPDSADGAGQTAPLALYTNGTKKQDLSLTSAFSWVYGTYPYTNTPAEGNAHHFYDETRALIGDQPAGTVVKLQKDSGSAAYVDVDLVDAEVVPAAAPAPTGALDVTSYGAVPNNGSDATAAIRNAIAAASAQNKPLYVPAGTFRITAAVDVANVKIFGAGPWRTVIQGTANRGGFFATGGNVTIADLAIFGDVRSRLDNASDAAIEGDFGTGSLLQNIWTEHTKVGMWPDSGTNGLYAVGMRIRDTFADGVNIHAKDGIATTNVRIDQSTFRNTGDDALAMFSESAAVTGSAYTFNTVQVPLLANGIGIYGGNGNRAEDNVVSDTVTASAGIAISTRFNPVAFSGTTGVRRNTLTRTGGLEPNWPAQLGGLWIYADTKDITAPIVVSDMTITDSLYQGILVSFQKTVTGLSFDRVTVNGAGTYGIELNAVGSASVANTVVTGAGSGGLLNSSGYVLNRGSGNSGF
ncbi:CBM35 domain-containing protein [Umezawaea tangerina]|uniref:Carbohydrate-binding protein with CBM35 doain n=1 Tax=Umezawaea tangerina TaxID=84725 RepID=A0A2T0T515_9PSEU|nr:CBM35 domain-containing protein [Umezawaea tangerina]PRY40775.1 carbohydrate-binding protein with CBM35 doain [Umezawaea tangerina]